MFKFRYFTDVAKKIGKSVANSDRPIICIQGLGFVGTAMAIAVAHARDSSGSPYYDVIGVDLPTSEGQHKIAAINEGKLPFECDDQKLNAAFQAVRRTGNLVASSDPEVYSLASVIVVDVNLDVSIDGKELSANWDSFRRAIRTLGKYMRAGCLVIVETTVPPGTCEKVIAPELARAMRLRGLKENGFLLAHSYERVMPGKEYFDSIVNFWRVYAGHTPEAADVCEDFLSKIINVEQFPLTRLNSTTASETAKVLENSYRAVNIAFMEEWGRFAESVGIDLFEIISAIRKRPTHSNMRQPGFGVGGYCLTKDPLLATVSVRELFEFEHIEFPFSSMAITVNSKMPIVSIEKLKKMLGVSLKGKSILLLGVSYRQDVGDTRYSPSEVFVRGTRAHGAKVECHDPFVDFWPELSQELLSDLPSADNFDAVVFAVPHEQYKSLDVNAWLNGCTPAVLDANNVLSKKQREAFMAQAV